MLGLLGSLDDTQLRLYRRPTTLLLMGEEPGNPDLLGYINQGEIPYLKLYDHNNHIILPLDISNLSYSEIIYQDYNQNGIWDPASEAEPPDAPVIVAPLNEIWKPPTASALTMYKSNVPDSKSKF